MRHLLPLKASNLLFIFPFGSSLHFASQPEQSLTGDPWNRRCSSPDSATVAAPRHSFLALSPPRGRAHLLMPLPDLFVPRNPCPARIRARRRVPRLRSRAGAAPGSASLRKVLHRVRHGALPLSVSSPSPEAPWNPVALLRQKLRPPPSHLRLQFRRVSKP